MLQKTCIFNQNSFLFSIMVCIVIALIITITTINVTETFPDDKEVVDDCGECGRLCIKPRLTKAFPTHTQ